MHLNSEKSIELGRRVHRRYGSWEAARRAGAAIPIDIVGDLDDLASRKRRKIVEDAVNIAITRLNSGE